MATRLSIQHYAKTQDGLELISRQVPFCVGGDLWQGYKGTAVPIRESQLTDAEMAKIVDVDESIERVRVIRRQRLESRFERKQEEYGERIAKLRARRLDITRTIKEQKEAGFDASPGDLHELKRIDKRMERLMNLSEEDSIAAVKISLGEQIGECDVCGEKCPEGSDFASWLRGHKVGKHTFKRRSAGKKEAASG